MNKLSLFSKSVSKCDFCVSREQGLVCIEIIPHDLIDVVSHSIRITSTINHPLDDSTGFETYDDTIIGSKGVGLSLLANVKPENLLFLFSERIQFLKNGFFSYCLANDIPYNPHDFYGADGCQDGACGKQDDSEPRAVVLCKINNSDIGKEIFGGEQKYRAEDHDCYQVSWGQLNEIDNLRRKKVHSLSLSERSSQMEVA